MLKTPIAVRNQIARFTGPEYFRMFDVARELRDMSTLYTIYPHADIDNDFTLAIAACEDRDNFVGLRGKEFQQTVLPFGASDKHSYIGYRLGLQWSSDYFTSVICKNPTQVLHLINRGVKFDMSSLSSIIRGNEMTLDNLKIVCEIGRSNDPEFKILMYAGTPTYLRMVPVYNWLHDNDLLKSLGRIRKN